jgi:uncharacterized protein
MKDVHKQSNRLVNEKSPYLLQHAYNPVDWFPWGEEAFDKAKKEDKPIFLSIGYSTCHWCHVMERESFEDNDVAEVLNQKYISIKVDREERPDIDHIYMTFCQAITGHGGWPLTIFMTPEKKPFFAGTYFPKRSKQGHSGLIDLLHKINNMWIKDKIRILQSSSEISKNVEKAVFITNKEEIGKKELQKTFEEFSYFFDSAYGGFGTAPKFPTPHTLSYLLRYWKVTKEKKALTMAEKTLESMYKGGIFDHIGFGFARYATDQKWLVPHFEKMLYDNALLAFVYTEAFQATGRPLYREVAEKIFAYILRDMTFIEGGFYSAEDADSEGVEGKFYVWDTDEVKKVVGEEDGNLYCSYYDIEPWGNFEGKSIPNLINTKINDLENNPELTTNLNRIREKLFVYREKRVHPHKDDKILTSWNGLMIAALSYAGRVLDNEKYIVEAKKAVEFIEKKLTREDGRLLARYRDGEAAYIAYLDDYAFLIWGLLELYDAALEPIYLKKAVKLNEEMIRLFWDEINGGLYIYGSDGEQLIVRPKDIYDGALPSGNSVAALNMLKLSKITGDEELKEKAQAQFNAFGGNVKKNPNSYAFFMMALLFNSVPTKEIVIAGNKENEDTRAMLEEINKRFLPMSTLVLNNGSEELYETAQFAKKQKKIKNSSTAYICDDFSCNEPTAAIEELVALLEKEQRL